MFVVPDVHNLSAMKGLVQFEIKCFQKTYKFWTKEQDLPSLYLIKEKLEPIFQLVEDKYPSFSLEYKLLAISFLCLEQGINNVNTDRVTCASEAVHFVLDKIIQESGIKN